MLRITASSVVGSHAETGSALRGVVSSLAARRDIVFGVHGPEELRADMRILLAGVRIRVIHLEPGPHRDNLAVRVRSVRRNRVRQIFSSHAVEALPGRHVTRCVEMAEQIVERSIFKHQNDHVIECSQTFAWTLRSNGDLPSVSAHDDRRSSNLDELSARNTAHQPLSEGTIEVFLLCSARRIWSDTRLEPVASFGRQPDLHVLRDFDVDVSRRQLCTVRDCVEAVDWLGIQVKECDAGVSMRGKLIGVLAAAAIAGPSPAEEGPLPKEFEAIETIVVVFLENRSFVNLLPSFPGALGIAQASPEAILQRDRDGSILPHLPPVWESGAKTPDPAYPASMPNAPFAIDEKPYDRPGSVLTVSPVHRFYQNRMQINDGKNDMFVAWTDVGSPSHGALQSGGHLSVQAG